MADVGRAPDVRDRQIHPVAGGMAGGSADAAAVLAAMNSLWELTCPYVFARLGSDVPFALHEEQWVAAGVGHRGIPQHLPLVPGCCSPPRYNELDRLRSGGPPGFW